MPDIKNLCPSRTIAPSDSDHSEWKSPPGVIELPLILSVVKAFNHV